MKNRRGIRETTLQALYAYQAGNEDREHVISSIIKPKVSDDKEGLRFAEKLFLNTLQTSDIADAEIEKHIKNWEIDRLAIIDRLVLRMAISEFIHFDDIPPKVTINEAIEIAKRFSTSKSGRFVNGILDAVLESLSAENRLTKSGRGLLNQTQDQQKSQ
ncbi:MAG: transcription antitermination factor NusB [Balneolales bacterium]